MTVNWWKESTTIYERLVKHNLTAKIYYNDATIALTYGGMLPAQDKHFVPDFTQFFRDCKANNLPDYCFLEPALQRDHRRQSGAASDQHPDHDVSNRESLILDVYNAIRFNPDIWNMTLLVICYDEHGGLFDHIAPPSAIPPDAHQSRSLFFAFERLGVSVPAVLVSPYIEKGNHCERCIRSAATARKVLIGSGSKSTFLTARDRNANTFERVLTRSSPRDAKEVDPTHFHRQVNGRACDHCDGSRLCAGCEAAIGPQVALMIAMASAAAASMTQQHAAQMHANFI